MDDLKEKLEDLTPRSSRVYTLMGEEHIGTDYQPILPSRIAELTGVENGQLTVVLLNLEDAGFLRRSDGGYIPLVLRDLTFREKEQARIPVGLRRAK